MNCGHAPKEERLACTTPSDWLCNGLTAEADLWRKELYRFGVFSVQGVHPQVTLPGTPSAEGFR